MNAISIFNRIIAPLLFMIIMLSALSGCHLLHHGHNSHHGHSRHHDHENHHRNDNHHGRHR